MLYSPHYRQGQRGCRGHGHARVTANQRQSWVRPRQTGCRVSAQSHRTMLQNTVNSSKESLMLCSAGSLQRTISEIMVSQLPRITKIGNICGQSYLPILLLHLFYANSYYQAQLPFDKPD